MSESGQEYPARGGDPRQQSQIRHLEDENEQLRVSLEVLGEEAKALAEEREEAKRKLEQRTMQLRRTKAKLAEYTNSLNELRSKLSLHTADLRDAVLTPSENAAIMEELHAALEETQVLAEKLEDTNAALSLANQEQDQRVATRTAALAAANDALRRSEEHLHLALAFADAGTWELQTAGDPAIWSREWCVLHGVNPETTAPHLKVWTDCIHPDDRPAVEAALMRCFREGWQDFSVEYRLRHPQSGERWLAGRGRLLHDEHGNPAKLMGMTSDITQRKAAELVLAGRNTQLEQQVEAAVAARQAAQIQLFQTMKMEALGQLTGGVAHDFNNVLAVLISGMTLLLRTESEDRRGNLLQSMMQAARRGASLTRRLLSFARRQPLQSEPLEVEPWLQEMNDLAAPVLRAGIRLRTKTVGDVGSVLVDRNELELAIINVLVNARDAMPQDGTVTLSARKVHLRAGSDPDRLEGDFVVLSVRDEGHGVPPELLPRIFEPFFTTKSLGKGTGLGLPQVYGFAQQSGGTVRVASEVGKGTEVSLLLPCAQGTAPSPATAPLEAQAASPLDQPLKILLVADDKPVAKMTCEMLKALGHTVRCVGNAEEALRTLDEASFDFLLTDVMLGGGPDGIELAVTVSRLWPNLPLLLASGYGGMPERLAAARLPLLRKPFGGEDLRQAIRAVCTRAGRLPSPRPGKAARPEIPGRMNGTGGP